MYITIEYNRYIYLMNLLFDNGTNDDIVWGIWLNGTPTASMLRSRIRLQAILIVLLCLLGT